ncbi:hypothetical protein HJ590_17090 [Naumannella sp. ID2617S]|nr:hypothetical protein [Naumannella sp. ID2617S]
MRIYGPADLLTAAGTVRQGLNDSADQVRELIELIPRVIAMVDRAETLLTAAEEALEVTDDLLAGAEQTRLKVDAVATRAGTLVKRSEALVGRTEAMLEPMEKLAPTALPLLQQVVESIDPNEVRAIKGMIDRLPGMLDQIDHIGPDVNRILDAVTDLTAAMQGLPGMGALKRRGERKADESDDSEPGDSDERQFTTG